MKILTGRLLPKLIAFATEAPEAPTKEEGGLAGLYQKEMDGGADDPAKETPPAKEAKPVEKKEPEKKVEKTKRDPLLDVLDSKKETEQKEVNPEPEAEEAKKAREAELTEATKGMQGKVRENFEKAMNRAHTAEQKAATLEKELTALKAQKVELPAEVKAQLAELESLRKDHKEVMDQMERIGVERSPGYQNKFVKGRKQLVDKAVEMMKRYGGADEKFLAALELSGKQRSTAMAEALEGMEDYERNRVASLINQIEDLDEEGAKYLLNASESLQQQEVEAQRAEREQRTQDQVKQKEAFMVTANSMLRKFPEDHPLAAETNPMVDQVIADAQKFMFEETNFQSFSEAAIAKAMFPHFKQRLGAAAQRIAELEQQLEEMSAAEPGTKSGGGDDNGADDQPKSLAQRYNDAQAA